MGVRKSWSRSPAEQVRPDKDIDNEKEGSCLGCFQVYNLCICALEDIESLDEQ